MGSKFYPAGSLHCEKCGCALPETVCWHGKKHFICDGPGCAAPGMRPLIRIESRPCSNPGCPGTVPERLCSSSSTLQFCTSLCESRYWYSHSKSVTVHCAYCGEPLRRSPSEAEGLCFCAGHDKAYKSNLRDESECGGFRDLFRTYLEQSCIRHYENLYPVRSEIRQFLTFVDAQGIADIQAVTPATIRDFLAQRSGHARRADYVKTMFRWLIKTGRYQRENPVKSRVHYKRRRRVKARPYSEQDMARIETRLEECGITQAKLIIAMGGDFGPRRIDLCKIQRTHINFRQKLIWLVNSKSKQVGYVPFGSKTEHWLRIWLEERPKNLNHDFLLVNSRGGPMRWFSLTYLLKSVLLKKWGKEVRANGLDRFCFHRLRHTNTTKIQAKGIDPQTNMKVHGWAHEGMVYHYSEPTEEEILREMTHAFSAQPPSPINGGRVPLMDFVRGERGASLEEESTAG